jgi:hypothetical protein
MEAFVLLNKKTSINARNCNLVQSMDKERDDYFYNPLEFWFLKEVNQ